MDLGSAPVQLRRTNRTAAQARQQPGSAESSEGSKLSVAAAVAVVSLDSHSRPTSPAPSSYEPAAGSRRGAEQHRPTPKPRPMAARPGSTGDAVGIGAAAAVNSIDPHPGLDQRRSGDRERHRHQRRHGNPRRRRGKPLQREREGWRRRRQGIAARSRQPVETHPRRGARRRARDAEVAMSSSKPAAPRKPAPPALPDGAGRRRRLRRQLPRSRSTSSARTRCGHPARRHHRPADEAACDR